jgi:hypothetical protein
MKRTIYIVIVCIPICYFALIGFAVFWKQHNSAATESYNMQGLPAAAEEEKEVTTLLPIISGEWVRQADLLIMELAHGWIVRRSPANGGGLIFVPKPKADNNL